MTLAEQSLAQRIAVRVPYFTSVTQMLAQSDLIVTLSQSMAEAGR